MKPADKDEASVDMGFDELDASIERMRLDLAKALICRALLPYLNAKVGDHEMRLMQRDAEHFAHRLRLDNAEFIDLPQVFVTLVDGNALAIRWKGEVP